MLKKITFPDKINTLEISGKYVFSADNVNEIKDVVNSLIDYLSNGFNGESSLYKYIFITLPEKLEDAQYHFKVNFSSSSFSSELSLIQSTFDQFLVFENNEFKSPSSEIITKNDALKIFLIQTPQEVINNLPVNVSYSLYNDEVSVSYPLGYSPFKKLADLVEPKFFTIRNDEDLNLIKFAIENNLFDQIKDRIIYQFTDSDADKYVTNISAVLYKGENNIDITPSSLEFLKSNMIGSQISADYLISNGDLSSSISIVQIPNDIHSKYFLNNFSSLGYASGLMTDNYYDILNHNEFKLIENNFTSSVLIQPNETYDNSRYVLLSSSNDEHIIKELNKYPTELKVELNSNTITSSNNSIQLNASLIYSDNSSENIQNINVRFVNNDKNTLIFNDNTLSCNNITEEETKFVIFSYKLKNNITLYDIKSIMIR